MIKIIPALLTDEPKKLETYIRQSETFTDYVQIDIMDGMFVPSKSIKAEDLAKIKTKLFLEMHLMVKDPINYAEVFKNAGAKRIIFHYEATGDVDGTIRKIQDLGLSVGIAINPETKIEALEPFLNKIDSVLFLSVNPGFYGSPFVPEVLDKIRKFRKKYSQAIISIDGGIKADNIKKVADTGVNSICVGSAILKDPNPKEAFQRLLKSIK
jgi:ribulose-phosphate 3-epimerase